MPMVKNYTSIQLSNCEPMRGYDRISWKRLPHVVHAVNSGKGGPPCHIFVPNYVAQDESYQFRTQMTFNKDTPLQDVPSHLQKGTTRDRINEKHVAPRASRNTMKQLERRAVHVGVSDSSVTILALALTIPSSWQCVTNHLPGHDIIRTLHLCKASMILCICLGATGYNSMRQLQHTLQHITIMFLARTWKPTGLQHFFAMQTLNIVGFNKGYSDQWRNGQTL